MDLEDTVLSEISQRKTIPDDFTYMQNKEWNKGTKQKWTQRYTEETDEEENDGCQMGGGGGLSEKGEGIEEYKLVVTEQSQGCKVQHREYS